MFYKPIDDICHPHGNIHNYEDFINKNIDCSLCRETQEKKLKEIEELKKTEKEKQKNIIKNKKMIELLEKETLEEIKIKKLQKYKDFLERRNKYQNEIVIII